MLSPGSERKLLMPAAGAADEASNGADGGATTTMTTVTTTVTATATSTTTTVMSSPSPPMSSASPPITEAASPAAASDQAGVASPVASASSRLSSPVNAVSVSHQQVQLRIDSSSESASASNGSGVGSGTWDNLAQASPTQFLAALQANSNLLSARALDRFKADAQADLEMVEADKEAAGGAALALADSTVSLETLPASSFYALFKSHVLKMYMSLMQAQHDLEQKEMVCARALERVRCLEDVINDVRLQEKEEEKEDEKEAEEEASAAAAAASKAAAPALENSLSPPEVSPAPALSPFSPTSPSSVLEEATARLRETSRRSSGVLGSPSTPSKDAAVTPGGRPAHSRRSSVGIDALLQSRSSRTASTLNSPRAGGPGDVMGSATPAGMDGSGLFTPMGDESASKFSVEAQRILQLQQTIEDLRAQTEAAEEKLAASRADVAKARAEAEARMRAQLNAAQDEALDRARRVEELETEVERHRLQELQWADLLMQHHKAQPHAAKLADAMAVARAGSSPIVVVSPPGADGTPIANASATPASSSSGGDPIASPASYNLSALSSPNSYLLSDPMRTPPVDSAPLQVTPVTIESATADESAAGAASPAFALPTFDSRVSYLRSVLDTANRSAAAIPQLHDLLQQSAARLAEMEQRPTQQRPGAGAGPDSGADDRDAQLAAARDREEKLNRRIAELSDELAHVHDQHELQLSPLRAELAAAPVFDFAFSSGPPSAVTSPRPPAAATSGSSGSAPISNPNFGSGPVAPLAAPLSTSSPSHEWLQQTIQLQNSILELSAEIQQLRNSKRDLVKHSSQELKRMRAEVMQLRGLPVPDESAAAAAAPAANSASVSAATSQADKTCVLQ